jgi:hypothetical protein
MARLLEDRRSGRDRRRASGPDSAEKERRRADRRQFPPPLDPSGLSAAGRELQQTIDAYKKERGLMDISIDELLGLMSGLGYRRA